MNKYKLYMLVSIVILLFSIGGSIAYYVWTSTGRALVNVKVCTPYVSFIGGTTINGGNIKPVLSREEAVIKEVEMKADKTCDSKITMNLYMNLEVFGEGLADESFVYEVYSEGKIVSKGDFKGRKEGDTITLIEEEELGTTKKVYTIYIYLDGNKDNPVSTQNQSFRFKLWSGGEGAIYKENVITNINRPTSSKDSFFSSEVMREEIETITIAEDNKVPDGIESVDISSNKDGSVMMWYEDKDENGMYEVYIGGENGIIEANTNGSGLFSYLTNIESLNLNKLDTSYMTSMSYMFYNSSSLKEIDISNFNTSKVTAMNNMFSGCENLTSLDLSSFDTSNVTKMDYMFYNCKSLPSLDLSNFNTGKVTTMYGMFYNSSNLRQINTSNFNTSHVTDMGNMFAECNNLTSLNLSSFDTSNVENMTTMFFQCKNLRFLNISSFNTENVTNMGRMFYNCQSLTNLDLSNFNTSKVTVMNSMFNGCGSLTNLDLSSFDTSNVTAMDGMFTNCSSLTSLDLSSFDTLKVTDMGSIFHNCRKLISLDIRNFDFSNVTSYSNMFYGISTTTIYVKDSTAKEWIISKFNNLTNIVIP